MRYKDLNRYDITPDDERYSTAWRRVLARLGDYTAIIVQSLNMRPSDVELLAQTRDHVLVRISTPGEHYVLRIAPEGHLAREVYFGRALAAQHLPATRIIFHDLSCTLVPFNYTLESYIGGIAASQLEQSHLLRAVARQLGHTLRRVHRIKAPGWGAPDAAGRWLTADWAAALIRLQTALAPEPADRLVFGAEEQTAIVALREYLVPMCQTPYLIHGAVGPHMARCTVGDHVQLAALIDPGPIIGGDGLLDLALGTDPAYPEPWRNGLIEGYVATMPLNASEKERLRLMQTLIWYWQACWHYMRAEPYQATRDQALALLQAWIKQG